MQKLLVIILCLVCMKNAKAQRSYDGECIVGFDGVILTFDGGLKPSITLPKSRRGAFSLGASSISDSNGHLIIASSTHDIYNVNADTMEGGYRVTPAKIAAKDAYYSSWTQNSIILPKSNNEYLIFTKTMSDAHYDLWSTGGSSHFDMLTYHVVDMNANNGLGKVVEKNKIIMKDAVLSMNRMTAVKHGNGRDWWLVVPHQREHIFYLFMVGQDGQISEPITRTLDYPPIDSLFGGQYGQSSFNHAGDKYAYCTYTTGGIFVLNFDRCTGEFSKHHFYSIPRDTSLPFDVPIGNQFSPNDSFLYVNTMNNIFQIDINNPLPSSLQFIHGPDIDSANEYNQQYSNIYMGGDDRMYIGNFDAIKSTMSYLEYPNRRGLASGFCRRCLKVPNINTTSLPNIPYYHLGKKVGSVCDTIREAPIWEAIRIYPNPVSGMLNVYLPLEENTEVSIGLYNIMGQKVFSSNEEINALQQFTVDMNALAKGIYILRIESEDQVWKEKVVKE